VADEMRDEGEGRYGNRMGGSRSAADKKKRGKKKKTSFRKKRPPATLSFDYKDLDKILPFLTEEGKIVSGRVSGLRASQQRELTISVKRARNVGFVSAVSKDFIH
jgi:small subunit ribosomal protein S18